MSEPAEVFAAITWRQAIRALEKIEDSEDAGAFCQYDVERLRLLAKRIEDKITQDDGSRRVEDKHE